MSPNLERISVKARAKPDLVFTSLYHHIADPVITQIFSVCERSERLQRGPARCASRATAFALPGSPLLSDGEARPSALSPGPPRGRCGAGGLRSHVIPPLRDDAGRPLPPLPQDAGASVHAAQAGGGPPFKCRLFS